MQTIRVPPGLTPHQLTRYLLDASKPCGNRQAMRICAHCRRQTSAKTCEGCGAPGDVA